MQNRLPETFEDLLMHPEGFNALLADIKSITRIDEMPTLTQQHYECVSIYITVIANYLREQNDTAACALELHDIRLLQLAARCDNTPHPPKHVLNAYNASSLNDRISFNHYDIDKNSLLIYICNDALKLAQFNHSVKLIPESVAKQFIDEMLILMQTVPHTLPATIEQSDHGLFTLPNHYRSNTLTPSNTQRTADEPKRTTPLLLVALKCEHIHVLQTFVTPENINDVFLSGTMLHHATKRNQIDMMRFLLQSGADIEAKNASGLTALHIAVNKQYPDATKLLLSYHADANAQMPKNPRSPLAKAVSLNNARIVKLLVTANADLNCNYFNIPLLNYACSHRKNMALILLEAGANPNTLSLLDESPLHRASSLGHRKVVKALLKRGADVNHYYNGATPLHRTIINSISHNDRKNSRRLRTTELLLKYGAHTEATNSDGLTPLACAAVGNANIDFVRLLLLYRANVYVMGLEGVFDESLIHFAAIHESTQLLELFLVQGTDPNTPSRNMVTPLHLAALEGRDKNCALLLDAGANIHAKTTYDIEFNPLDYAIRAKQAACVKLLLERGAIMSQRSFLFAVLSEDLTIVKSCLKHGAVITPEILSAYTSPEISAYLHVIADMHSYLDTGHFNSQTPSATNPFTFFHRTEMNTDTKKEVADRLLVALKSDDPSPVENALSGLLNSLPNR